MMLFTAEFSSGLIGKDCNFFTQNLDAFIEWSGREIPHLFTALTFIIIAAIAAVACELIIFRLILRPFSKKHPDSLNGYIVSEIRVPLYLFIFIAGLRSGAFVIEFPLLLDKVINKILQAAMWIVLIWLMLRIVSAIDANLKRIMTGKTTELDGLLIDLIRRVLRSLIWIFAGIMFIQNVFSLNVTALLAGAGVAGLAIAFAAQNTIANIFGAVIILLDKAFSIGEVITINGSTGVVEKVGLRSTSLRSFDGNVLTIPNRVIADSEITNISRRPNIKYTFKLGLVYSTTPDMMRRALDILHEILDTHPGFDMEKLPPKIYFTDFDDSAISITVIVWFQTKDFTQLQQWKNDINLEILARFNAEGLSFAYPSQSIYIEKN